MTSIINIFEKRSISSNQTDYELETAAVGTSELTHINTLAHCSTTIYRDVST